MTEDGGPGPRSDRGWNLAGPAEQARRLPGPRDGMADLFLVVRCPRTTTAAASASPSAAASPRIATPARSQG